MRSCAISLQTSWKRVVGRESKWEGEKEELLRRSSDAATEVQIDVREGMTVLCKKGGVMFFISALLYNLIKSI
jgi:hypothetical protein